MSNRKLDHWNPQKVGERGGAVRGLVERLSETSCPHSAAPVASQPFLLHHVRREEASIIETHNPHETDPETPRTAE